MTQHEASRPQHIFNDVLDRWYDTDRQRLQVMVDRRLEELKIARIEFSLTQYTKAQFDDEKGRLGQALLTELMQELQCIEFKNTSPCSACGRECVLSPRTELATRECFWVEAAGSVCKAWSTYGSQGKCLSEYTLSTLVWIWSTTSLEPDIVLHENTPGFDSDLMKQIMKDTRASIPRSIFARPWAASEATAARSYNVVGEIFGPAALGVPSARRRKYLAFHLSPFSVMGPNLDFGRIFFRERLADASVYLVASAEIMQAELHERLAACAARDGSLQPSQLREFLQDEDLAIMTGGEVGRLESWKVLAHRPTLCDAGLDNWAPSTPMAVVDITQNADYVRCCSTHVFPTLLTESVLYDLLRNRRVTCAEHWLVQGFAQAGVPHIPPRCSKYFPFPSLVFGGSSREKLRIDEQRQLTGNAMHWAAIASWFAFNLMGDAPGMSPAAP